MIMRMESEDEWNSVILIFCDVCSDDCQQKQLEQKFIFQIGTLNPHGINERSSFN